ncbi:MAG: right-handed parallel beta-helix repeat-containing protein, partial [Bacteroidales bacterium]|nr:right-handed parallel beta-helix repeat-containing protein [Bacteroidales bacterium]
MKGSIIPTTLLLLICLWFTSCSGPTVGSTYYISADGDDSNSGLAEGKAWQTIERVNEQDFSPGDRILFRSGDIFQGTISFSAEDAGTKSSKLIVSSFGEEKAIISGEEAEGLKADSCQYLTIERLEFSGMGRISGNTTDGLLIYQSDGIVIHNLEVYGFQHSGVHLHQCNDAVIKHVYAHENGFAGIHVTGTTIWDTAKYDNHNLYIGYCVAENNPGDPSVLTSHSGNGILASSVKG